MVAGSSGVASSAGDVAPSGGDVAPSGGDSANVAPSGGGGAQDGDGGPPAPATEKKMRCRSVEARARRPFGNVVLISGVD